MRLNLETHLDQMTVAAIHEKPYEGEAFPGHDLINHTLRELRFVVRQNRPDWRIALESIKGVYVIHDQETGEPYVGAAYADEGIWHRLSAYAETLHGNNVGLKALVETKGEDYALRNLRFALLEFWSKRTEDQRVIDRARMDLAFLSRELIVERSRPAVRPEGPGAWGRERHGSRDRRRRESRWLLNCQAVQRDCSSG